MQLHVLHQLLVFFPSPSAFSILRTAPTRCLKPFAQLKRIGLSHTSIDPMLYVSRGMKCQALQRHRVLNRVHGLYPTGTLYLFLRVCIILKFASSSFIGYVDTVCINSKEQFALENMSTALSMSSYVLIPVEIKVCFPSSATISSNSVKTSIADAILLNEQSNFLRKFLLFRSKRKRTNLCKHFYNFHLSPNNIFR